MHVQAMVNGKAQSAPVDENGTPVISVNVGLSKREILTAGGLIVGMLSTFITSGILFYPAKDSDLKALKGEVEIIRQNQIGIREGIDRLNATVERMESSGDRLAPTPRRGPRPAPAPLPAR